jgi:hypothetical protein
MHHKQYVPTVRKTRKEKPPSIQLFALRKGEIRLYTSFYGDFGGSTVKQQTSMLASQATEDSLALETDKV